MAFRLALDFFVIVLAAWFWPHCARPVLIANRASPAAHWLVLAVTVLMVAAHALDAVAEIAQVGYAIPSWSIAIVGGLWTLVVGLGYLQDYALLRRATERRSSPQTD
jgi:hypothetical protein